MFSYSVSVQKRAQILNYLKIEFEKNPMMEIPDKIISKFTKIPQNEVASICMILHQDGLLDRGSVVSQSTMWKINSTGISALNSTYNATYQAEKQAEQSFQQGREQDKEREQVRTEEKRHRETLDAQKKSAKWTKIGVISALIISFVALLVSTFKP